MHRNSNRSFYPRATAWITSVVWAVVPFGYSDLLELVQGGSIKNVMELLPRLPSGLRSPENYHLVYTSRSLQSSSPDFPRVILESASLSKPLLIAFAGDPSAPDYNELEVIHWDRAEKRYRFARIDFKDPSKPPVVEADPAQCLNCHGKVSPHPIWESYPNWPGVYGSEAPVLAGERASFKKMVARHTGVDSVPSVYHHLSDLSKVELEALEKNNTQFSVRLQRINRQRIASLLAGAGETLRRYSAALTSALTMNRSSNLRSYLPCADQSAFAADFATVLQDTIEKTTAYVEAKEKIRHKRFSQERLYSQIPFDVEHAEEVARVRYVVENLMGLSMREWSLTRAPGTYSFTAGDGSLSEIFYDLFPNVPIGGISLQYGPRAPIVAGPWKDCSS